MRIAWVSVILLGVGQLLLGAMTIVNTYRIRKMEKRREP